MKMSMLAEKRKRVKYCLNPNGNLWNNDNDKFGQKLLEKMGWKKGQGLGVNNQGITERLKMSHKFDSRGLGFKEKDGTLEKQTDFQNLLDEFNKKPENLKIEVAVSSLEEKSKKSKSRVHYQKFTRGKDISRYSSKDLISILGSTSQKNHIQASSQMPSGINGNHITNASEYLDKMQSKNSFEESEISDSEQFRGSRSEQVNQWKGPDKEIKSCKQEKAYNVDTGETVVKRQKHKKCKFKDDNYKNYDVVTNTPEKLLDSSNDIDDISRLEEENHKSKIRKSYNVHDDNNSEMLYSKNNKKQIPECRANMSSEDDLQSISIDNLEQECASVNSVKSKGSKRKNSKKQNQTQFCICDESERNLPKNFKSSNCEIYRNSAKETSLFLKTFSLGNNDDVCTEDNNTYMKEENIELENIINKKDKNNCRSLDSEEHVQSEFSNTNVREGNCDFNDVHKEPNKEQRKSKRVKQSNRCADSDFQNENLENIEISTKLKDSHVITAVHEEQPFEEINSKNIDEKYSFKNDKKHKKSKRIKISNSCADSDFQNENLEISTKLKDSHATTTDHEEQPFEENTSKDMGEKNSIKNYKKHRKSKRIEISNCCADSDFQNENIEISTKLKDPHATTDHEEHLFEEINDKNIGGKNIFKNDKKHRKSKRIKISNSCADSDFQNENLEISTKLKDSHVITAVHKEQPFEDINSKNIDEKNSFKNDKKHRKSKRIKISNSCADSDFQNENLEISTKLKDSHVITAVHEEQPFEEINSKDIGEKNSFKNDKKHRKSKRIKISNCCADSDFKNGDIEISTKLKDSHATTIDHEEQLSEEIHHNDISEENCNFKSVADEACIKAKYVKGTDCVWSNLQHQHVNYVELNLNKVKSKIMSEHSTTIEAKNSDKLKSVKHRYNNIQPRVFKKMAFPKFEGFKGSNWTSVDGYGIAQK